MNKKILLLTAATCASVWATASTTPFDHEAAIKSARAKMLAMGQEFEDGIRASQKEAAVIKVDLATAESKVKRLEVDILAKDAEAQRLDGLLKAEQAKSLFGKFST